MIVGIYQLFDALRKLKAVDRNLVAEKLTALQEKRDECAKQEKAALFKKNKDVDEFYVHYSRIMAEEKITLDDVKAAIERCPRHEPLELMQFACECKQRGQVCQMTSCTDPNISQDDVDKALAWVNGNRIPN